MHEITKQLYEMLRHAKKVPLARLHIVLPLCMFTSLTRFPALPSAPFAEELPELPELPVLSGQIGHLLPEEWEPLKTACFPKQMRHKNDRAVLTRLPHPVRHNRSACFITEIFELELPKSENAY